MKKHLEVVGAILVYDGKILCMQRGASKYPYTAYKYEFPGGKIEPGETPEQALERELREEMDIAVTVRPQDAYMTVEHSYPDFDITFHTYLCKVKTSAFTRKEHIAHQWLLPRKLHTVDWAPADAPITAKLATDGRLR